MRSLFFLSFLILLLIPSKAFAQTDSQRNLFQDAESWFLYEEYQEALPIYETLLEKDTRNYNLKYKIGICLLNDPYQIDRAISYLYNAAKHINRSCKTGSFREKTAPPDAIFYLGNAYLVNEMIDKAIETYEAFLIVMDREVYDAELVEEQIKACQNAKQLKARPVDIDLTLLDSLINTQYAEINPVLSGDGTRMAFVTRLAFYDGAFFTEKTEEGWSYPQPITQTLGFDSDVYPVGLSFDGTEMILYYDDEYTGNLYYSRYENGSWLPASKMGKNISTKYWETHACFSKDGQTLFFTSNRKGTYGGLDIFKSHRMPNGKWGTPENLGPTINSRYNEESPFISEDGNTLYFSSYGHYNMGGYDVFYSKKSGDGTWGEPVNMGYPINTTDNDLFFQPLNDGKIAYYSIYRPGGMGLHDIYRMDIYSPDNPRISEDVAKPLQIDKNPEKSGTELKEDTIQPKDSIYEVFEEPLIVPLKAEPIAKAAADMDTTPIVEQSPRVDTATLPETEIEEPVAVEPQKEEKGKQPGWLLPLILASAGVFLIWLILWRRRRKKEKE